MHVGIFLRCTYLILDFMVWQVVFTIRACVSRVCYACGMQYVNIMLHCRKYARDMCARGIYMYTYTVQLNTISESMRSVPYFLYLSILYVYISLHLFLSHHRKFITYFSSIFIVNNVQYIYIYVIINLETNFYFRIFSLIDYI